MYIEGGFKPSAHYAACKLQLAYYLSLSNHSKLRKFITFWKMIKNARKLDSFSIKLTKSCQKKKKKQWSVPQLSVPL